MCVRACVCSHISLHRAETESEGKEDEGRRERGRKYGGRFVMLPFSCHHLPVPVVFSPLVCETMQTRIVCVEE